jgi:hypothetical protein
VQPRSFDPFKMVPSRARAPRAATPVATGWRWPVRKLKHHGGSADPGGMFDDRRYRRRLPLSGGLRSFVARVCLAYIRACAPAGVTAECKPRSCPDASPPASPVPSSFWMF